MDGLTAEDPRTVGEFRLLARLGAGGMGQVFLASSLAGRTVAVKVIHSDLGRDTDFVRRFRHEVAAAQRVSGWYTAPVVAAGVDDKPPWLATAFVAGPSLDELITRQGPLPGPAVWRLAAGLAEALRAVHASGLVHRDLKPANVLLALDGPRVIDFGISRAVADTRLTVTGAVIGTPSYMSPEQVEARDTGPASDTFSLGSVLAFAAGGAVPFRVAPGGSSAAVMYRIVHAEPDLSAVPAEVRGLIEACLAKDPRQRPDLGQVASYSTAAAERLGLSPAAFWPPEVARVIQAQQDALTAQIEALQLAPAGPAPLTAAPAGPSYPAGLSYLASPAPSAYLSVPAPAPTPPPPGPAPTTAPGRSAGQLAPRGTSRRGVLIGAGVGGVAVIGGALGWVLSDRSPGTRGSASTGIGSAAVPTASSLSQYYGEGTRRKAQWRFRTGNAVEANPGAGGGLAYVGSSDNNVYAVSLASGDKAWSFPAASVTAAPQVIGSVVCLATQEGDFYALDAATGKRAWHVSGVTDAIYKRSWAAAGTQVILAGTDGTAVQAYDAASGAKGMSFTTQDSYVYTMTAAGGVLYAVDVSGILYAFRIADGTVIWHRQLLSDFSSNAPGTSLTVDNGSLYLGTTGGTLYALRTADGGQRWTYPPGSGMESDLTVSGGIVYLRDNNGTVHAVSAATGKRVWTKSAPGAGLYGPAVAGGRVYYSTDLALQALDARSGDPDWAFSPDSTALPSTPAVAGGLVLIGCQDDSLYAVKA